jgi:hypothetical protein
MTERRNGCLLLLTAALLSDSATALEVIENRLALNLFGTLGQSRSSLDTPLYKDMSGNNYGLGRQWSGALDQRYGMQLNLQLLDHVALVGQGLVQRNSLDETEWQTTWAYLRWQVDAHWQTSLGRFRHPLFMITEEFDIGYAWPWVRPPVELYSLAGESTYMDGGKLRWQTTVSDYTLALTGFSGNLQINRRPRIEYETQFNGLEAHLTDGYLTLRASLVQADSQLDSPRVQGIVDLIASQNPAVAEDYQVDDIKHQRYGNLGMRYENGNWLLMAEYVRLWLKSQTLPDKQAYYLTVGHNVGDFMPYATYARQEVVDSLNEYRLNGTPALAANALLAGSNTEQHTYSLGVRWDFYPGMALKGQLDQVYQKTPALGLQGAPLPSGRDHFTVTSFVLDWAF